MGKRKSHFLTEAYIFTGMTLAHLSCTLTWHSWGVFDLGCLFDYESLVQSLSSVHGPHELKFMNHLGKS